MGLTRLARPKRALSRDTAWVAVAAAFCIVGCVGVFAKVREPTVWSLLALTAGGAGLVLNALLVRVLAPLRALSARLAKIRATGGNDIVEPARYGMFSDLAARSVRVVRPEVPAPTPPGATAQAAASSDAHAAFLRSVSHELRSPLNAILGFTELLIAEVDGPVTHEQRDHLGVVRDAGQRLALLVTDLIDVAAITSGESMRARTTVEVGDVLEQVRDAAIERRGMRPVHVRVDVAPGAEYVVTERETLLRALRILTEHVLELTQSGEVSLLCERRAGEHVLRLRGDGLQNASAELQVLTGTVEPQEGRRRPARLRLAIAMELLSLLDARVEVERNASGQPSAIVVRLFGGEAL